ncbi:NAD-dependent epimerase/dehydratase family protein [Candidatus Roizmanbacteria bacterium]|nr:NAD-dependent epimerase/dehydratase family protein [Candidatus Roizmanbacteria bacterium]
MKNILVTGAFGQIGPELVPALQQKYGIKHVIAAGFQAIPSTFKGKSLILDVTAMDKLESIVKENSITEIYHMASIRTTDGEKNPDLAWEININGLKNILNVARDHQIKVFWPSSIAGFGITTPRDLTPQHTVQEPTTIYGITKKTGEILCNYYFHRYGVDVRSIRYSSIISWIHPPGNGTSDFVEGMFYGAVQQGAYECFVSPETRIPMMYIKDVIRATMMLMEQPPGNITIRTSYNIAALDASASELASAIQKRTPLSITYKPDSRDLIAKSWPNSLDDHRARRDWGWTPEYDLKKMTKEIVENLQRKFK